MNTEVDINEIHGMVSHWLNTPENGYLGNNYGSNCLRIIGAIKAGNDKEIDDEIKKIKIDVPALHGHTVSISGDDTQNSIVICIDGNCKTHPITH